MPGMPRRGIPTTYPAPPFDFTASGLIGLSPSNPVPCRREIFSSSVICLSTSDARSSGVRPVFIHGCGVFALALSCANAGDHEEPKMKIAMATDTDIDTVVRREV